MKKIRNLSILLMLLLGGSFISKGQTFGGGILGGLTASQLDGDNWGGYNKAGLTVGMFTNARFNKYIDAQIELKYIQKGSKSDSEEGDVFYLSKLNYIELPVFLKYRFLNRFSANIGVAIGFLQKSTEDKDRIGDEPADPPFNKYDFSALAGVEYKIIDKLFFNIHFNYSIVPIRSHPGDQTFFLDRGQYNNTLTFSVYYQIANFDKK